MNRVMMLAMVGCLWLVPPTVATPPTLPWIITADYIYSQLPEIKSEEPTPTEAPKEIKVTEAPEVEEKEYIMETDVTDAEFDLLADLVMAEAEDQSWDAQYGVACVVLNRVKSDLFPDTIHDVIYQKNPVQFSCTADGRLNKVIDGEPSDSVKEAVQSAIEKNTYPSDVLYFTSIGYLGNTEPYKQIDDMYFSFQK